MSDSAQNKQLPASARKLKKAREDGQVVRSRDLGHFLVLLASTAVLVSLTPIWMDRLQRELSAGLHFDARTVATSTVMLDRLSQWGGEALLVILPFAAGIALASVAASVLAGGWVMSFKVMAPHFGKLNPISGIGHLLSKQQLVDAVKASVMGLLMAAVGALVLSKAWPGMVALLGESLPAAIAELGHTLAATLGSMLLVMAVFALIDWPMQRMMFMSRMKMSHQDQKDEFKQQEGNIEIKGRMKQRMREMARKRMLSAVPKANLVVMNPSHYAVALQYDEATMAAPRVVAKGVDLIALKIRDVATEHRVPVLEAPPLARALYANTELDQEVPVALYSAVAQVLAYVFQLNAALSGRAPMPGNLPDLDVPAALDPHQNGKVPPTDADDVDDVEAKA